MSVYTCTPSYAEAEQILERVSTTLLYPAITEQGLRTWPNLRMMARHLFHGALHGHVAC